MSASIYIDKLIEPNDKMLAHDLDNAKVFLDIIASFIETEYGHLKPEWKYYNEKSGWILKMFNYKRNVLFVVPFDNYFRIAFTFGEKATEIVFSSNIPESIKKDLFETKKFVEGRTIRIDVKNETDLDHILTLIKIKLRN